MKVNDYVRTKCGEIAKIDKCLGKDGVYKNMQHYETDRMVTKFNNFILYEEDIIKSSPNIIDLVEYMDLLELEHPVKLYDSDTTIGLFNPVRCDGFTTFEDGTHCIILNMDYIVDVKDLKIKSVLTHEQYDSMKYKIGD